MTSRHLPTRKAEHQGKSFRTGLTLKSLPFCQVSNHTEENIHKHIDYNINKENLQT